MPTKIHAQFERKLRPDTHSYEFESAQLALSVSSEVSDEFLATLDENTRISYLDDTAQQLATQVQSRVLIQLGIPFHIDEQGRVIEEAREVVQVAQALQATVIGQVPAPAPVVAPPSPVPAAPPVPAPVVQVPAAVPAPVPVPPAAVAVPAAVPAAAPAQAGTLHGGQTYEKDVLIADVNAFPSNWYDNRSQKASDPSKSKHPDFRHKTLVAANGKNYAVWL